MAVYSVKCLNEECKDFGIVVDVYHGIKEEHPPCPLCNVKLVTHFSPTDKVNVVFKGKGWFNSGGY